MSKRTYDSAFSLLSAFDTTIHPFQGNNPNTPMPVCLEITAKTTQLQRREYSVSLIVLADVSESMARGRRMPNVKDGIRRLGELSSRLDHVRADLTLIEFNDTARIVYSSTGVPENLNAICNRLRPSGGTNIGSAIHLAMGVALGKKAAHIVLFTDGADTHGGPDTAVLNSLRTMPGTWLHCVGICMDADFRLLNQLFKLTRRGTIQSIKDGDIAQLMGALWGFMVEAVDPNCSIELRADGALVLKTEVALRIPGSVKVLCPEVPAGVKELKAVLFVGEETKETQLLLPADIDSNELCAHEYATWIQAEASTHVSEALQLFDYDAAEAITQAALDKLSGSQFTEVVAALEAQLADIALARTDAFNAREIEHRALSRSLTVVGASIDPSSRTLSELQSQLLF